MYRWLARVSVLFGLVGCGRVAFDPIAGGDGPVVPTGTAIGVLDPDLGGTGVFLYNYVDNDQMSLDDRATGVAIDGAGRIVASASGSYAFYTQGDQLDMAAITLRLLADGTLDPSYQSGALSIPGVTIDVGTSWSHATDLALGPSGAISVCGYREWGGTDDPTLYRYQPQSGELDPSLAGTGVVNVAFTGEVRCQGFAIDPADNAYVLAGESSAGEMIVARVRADGTPDPTFSGDGRVIFDAAGGDAAFDVAVDGAGRIYVVGTTTPATPDITAWRFLRDGTLDASFSGDGIFRYDGGENDVANAAALEADGDLVVVGASSVAGVSGAVVLRIDGATGELDPAFGTAGVFAHRNLGDAANGVMIDGTGAIYATGQIGVGGVVGPASAMAVWKLTANGAPDPTFGGGGLAGVFTTTAGAGGAAHVGWDLALDRAGRIVVAGESLSTAGYYDAAIWRIR